MPVAARTGAPPSLRSCQPHWRAYASADPQQLRHTLGKGSEPLTAENLVRLAKKLDVQARKVTVARGKLSKAMLLDLIQGPFKQVAFNLHRTDPEPGRRDKIRIAAHVGS